MLTGPDAFHVVATRLRDVVLQAVNDAGIGDRIARACVVPGAIAWDECDCGAVYVAVNRHYLSDSFPTARTNPRGRCEAAYLVAELTVVVARCAPVPDDNQVSVDCARLETAARVVAADARVALEAVACALSGWEADGTIAEGLVTDDAVVGPLGACVGTQVNLTVGLLRGIT